MNKKIKLIEIDWNLYRRLTENEVGIQNIIKDTTANYNFKNIRGFTVVNEKDEHVGIIEVFDNEIYENITNTIIAPEFRGMEYAVRAKEALITELKLTHLIFYIKRNNEMSLKSVNKLHGIVKISSPEWENIFDKFIFIWKPF